MDIPEAVTNAAMDRDRGMLRQLRDCLFRSCTNRGMKEVLHEPAVEELACLGYAEYHASAVDGIVFDTMDFWCYRPYLKVAVGCRARLQATLQAMFGNRKRHMDEPLVVTTEHWPARHEPLGRILAHNTPCQEMLDETRE
jgi:hypothetical protein